MDLKSRLKELKPHDLNCNVFDVYSYNGLSMQELLCQFFTKINECVEVSNNTLNLAEWLVNEGLEKEVVAKLLLWYNDGTLEQLINVTLFENLNKKIDDVIIQTNNNEEQIKNITLLVDDVIIQTNNNEEQIKNITLLVDENDGLNDNEKLQNAINKLNDFQQLKLTRDYKITGLTISNKNNIRIFGGKLSIENGTAIKMLGTCSNIEIDNIIIEGSGVNSRGIENNSGQILTNINIHSNTFKNLSLGVSLNADLSGSFKYSKVYNNHLENIVGTDPGLGYGIHLANAEFCEIFNNNIVNCGRHSIYHAKGNNNKIYNNNISYHRKDVKNNEYRPAIAIYRHSNNLSVYNNKLFKCYDCGIHVLCDGDSSASMYNVKIYNNEILDCMGIPSGISVGLGDSTVINTMNNIKIDNNIITRESDPYGLLVKINRGLNIDFTNNTLTTSNINGRVHLLEIGGNFDNTQFNNLLVSNNKFILKGTNTSTGRAIMFGGNITNTNTIKLLDNDFVDLFNDGLSNYINVDFGGVVTNTSLMYNHITNTYYSTSTTAEIPNKYHYKGDVYKFPYASSTGVYEKLCIQPGNPGTWRLLTTVGTV